MDSSNSGSFHSSSGATEEFDSTTHSISSFFNPNNLNHLLQPSHHHHRPPPTDTTFFNPSPLLNPIQDHPITPWTTKTTPPPQPNPHHHQTTTKVTIKNPKKRTRASRRAPTTVLTTDTTNFRQMVQEFTGIPTTPFSTTTATFPIPRRLDLLQKLQQPTPPFFNNPTANIVDSSTCNNITANPSSSSSGYKLNLSSIHELQKQPSSLVNLQNSMLTFQSFLQTSEGNDINGLQSSTSKRWREESGKLGSFEDGDIGLDNVRSGGDQVQGNQGSWICPSS